MSENKESLKEKCSEISALAKAMRKAGIVSFSGYGLSLTVDPGHEYTKQMIKNLKTAPGIEAQSSPESLELPVVQESDLSGPMPTY